MYNHAIEGGERRPARVEAADWTFLECVNDDHWMRDGHAMQKPRYAAKDHLVIYSVTDRKCPALFKVAREPEFDPERVERLGRPGDGERWGWLTEVNFLAAVDLAVAPSLEAIGVRRTSVRRHSRIVLSPVQYRLAYEAITRAPPKFKISRRVRRLSALDKPSVEEVPIEQQHSESKQIRIEAATKEITLNEQQLVSDYARHLAGQGRKVHRHRIAVADSGETLYSDLHEPDRNNLIEAKGDVSRGAIRTAIGQLADYSRFVDGAPRRAVLVPVSPSSDLRALLRSAGVEAVWPRGEGFEDTANGELT